ncbi:MAG: glycoside hydrolase family 95 protein [Oscillospiraceae bacterium]|nr:glycoside hydrolase family 95 protein [Oscillospiraceae bacterium]
MKKLISCMLSALMLFSVIAGLNITAVAAPTNIFGNAYNLIQDFDNRSSLPETEIGGTGYKVSTNSSNYNIVAVRDKSSENKGYYPYGKGLPENGYYLFFGAGGNGNVTAALTLPQTAAAGKYIQITYAKPYATNNGSANRNSDNSPEDKITVGTEVIDLKANCEFDTWYTSTVKLGSSVSQLTINLGSWGAIAISDIQIIDNADTLELTASDNVTEKYITPQNQTVQYISNVYNSVTTLMDSDEIVTRGTVDETAKVEYSVDYDGVSIDANGLLTITSSAQPGTVKISASYGGFTKSLSLLLKALGNADEVSIYGDEVVTVGGADVIKQYTAIPLADGIVMPERDTSWEIVGETNGASISDDGTLTVPAAAAAGVITIKATLTATEVQSSEVSAEFAVTIRNSSSEASPYNIQGLLLKNGETDITATEGIDGIIIEKTGSESAGYAVVAKVFDENNMVIKEETITINGLSDGVQSLKSDIEFSKAVFAKIYVIKTSDIPPTIEPTTEPTPDNGITYSDGKVTITADVDSAVLIYAQYDGDALKDVNVYPLTFTDGTAVQPLDAENGSKLMVWNKLEGEGGMTPVCDALKVGSSEVNIVKTYDAKETSNTAGMVVSDELFITSKGEYRNIPLVADWITGAKSGLGMGAGIMAPTGAPYGVDPDIVDVSTLNVKYTYDNNYQGPDTDNALWYKEGAYVAGNSSNGNSIYSRDGVDWEQEALPIGNGYMGGMLFGLPDKDQIQINEETFWAAGYRGTQTAVNNNTVNPNMSEGINGYMSVGNIFVDFDMPKGAAVNNYYRDLNLDESVAHVRYEYDGVTYNREYFASYPQETLAFRYTSGTAGALNFTVNPVSMHPGEVTVNNGEITIIGKLKDSEPYSSGGNAAWNQESDLEYCAKIKVIADDGEIIDGYNKVEVSGATGVTILVTAATDYDKDQFELNADGSVNMNKTPYKSLLGVQAAIDKAERRMSGAAALSYDELKTEHITDYKSQFDKVTFSLTDENEISDTPTDVLQQSYKNAVKAANTPGKTTDDKAGNNDEKQHGTISYTKNDYEALNKHLEELHFNYARYMMISSSRSDTMPATLQGKWCQSTAEIWGSCYCININMEMNYWFAGGANLLDSGKALVGWFNSQIPAGRITAKNMYKVTPKSYTYADGKITFTDSTDEADDVFIMHTKQAIMGTTDMTGSTSIQSPGNTAWLMYNLWDLYQTSGDKEVLENELYPIMRKAANFYTQYLYNNEKKIDASYPDGYYYTTWTGRSPEHGPTQEGVKYDLQLVAGMYDYTIAAAETLGVDADKVEAWKEIRNHLETPVELGDDGQIKEWAQEAAYGKDANGNQLGGLYHRHISHLVGLYPGTLITRDTPELLEGAKVVLENRGDASTGWSCSNKFLLWARALDGDKALELFRYQLAQRTYANLFDAHTPFQIDGNFGSAAGVMELLMQSQTGDIYILPALPTVWDKGQISGIKAKNGAEVSIKWENNEATEIKITPAVDGDITVGYEKDNTFTLDGDDVTFTDGKYTIANAEAGTEYVFVSK